MLVYLARHGEARTAEEDPERPLTGRGRRETALVARRLAAAGVRVAAIRHSGKLRAAQTAAEFASHLKPRGGVAAAEGLMPLDDPARARKTLLEARQPLMLVGHLPHLERLTSLLLVGDPAAGIVAFRASGVVCLRSEGEGWRLAWYLTPALAAG